MDKAEVCEAVCGEIRKVLPDLSDAVIDINHSLNDLGADSIHRAEVVYLSMRKLGIKVPLVEFVGIVNIAGLVDLLHSKVGSADDAK